MRNKFYEFYDRGWFLYIFVGILVLACLFGGCRALNKKLGLQNDNVIEEAIEEIIELNTGLKIDLTPEDYKNREKPCHL